MDKIWKINTPVPKEFLEKFPEYSRLTLQLLWDRNLKTQKAIDEFFNPDYDEDLHNPFLLKDIKKALKRIEIASKKKEKVAIFADYDADGICGAVLLHEILDVYKITPEVYIPDRNKEGYGLNFKAIEEIAKKGVKLILTIDCGVSDFKEVKSANKLGMDVIIIDHHEIPTSSVGRPKLPPAFAIINPKQKKCKYPFKDLAATGVAFKIVQAVKEIKKMPVSWEKWLLDLVAISTVTDSMLLLGENRTLVKYGLIVLSQTKRLGLKVLLEKARVKGDLNTYTLGWILGPRINAASRVDHGTLAFQLLLSRQKDLAEDLANHLEAKNQERQRQMEIIMKEAREKALKNLNKKRIIFETDENWTAGMLGLAAQKLKDEFWRPCFICQQSKEFVNCSARGGVAGFNVIKALNQCKEYLDEYGGHPYAGAFRAATKNLSKIQEILEKTSNQKLKDKDLIPFLNIDAEVDEQDLNWRIFDEIQKFSPFGSSNSEPLFLMRGLTVFEMRNVGAKNNHAKFVLKKGDKKFQAIGFGLAGYCDRIKIGDRIDVVFEMISNEWDGSKELQFKIMDLKKHKEA